MTQNSKTPKIRFAGFTDDWEQRKLKELVQFSKGSGYSKADLKEEGTPIILYGRLYTKYETAISNVDTFADPKPGSVFSRGGEVIVPASGETAEDISIASVVEKSGIILGGDLNVITPFKDIDPAFLAISISFGTPHMDMAKMAQGKSIVHLHNSDLEKIDFLYPKHDEQKKICSYFRQLDNLITLHQRKLSKLNNIKKAMLEKMFPQNGKNVPEIRFAGFTDAWEQRKLSQLGSIITGSTPSTQVKAYYSENGIPWVTPTDISDNVTFRTAKHITNEGQKVARVVPKNTILVTCIASIGKNTMLGTTGSFNQQINGLLPNEKENHPYFLLAESTLWSDKMKRTAASGTMQIVNKTEFSEIDTYVPPLDEQKLIGEYFQNLDNLITLHQRKLDKLMNIKKSMLEKMFV